MSCSLTSDPHFLPIHLLEVLTPGFETPCDGRMAERYELDVREQIMLYITDIHSDSCEMQTHVEA